LLQPFNFLTSFPILQPATARLGLPIGPQ